MKYLRWLAIVTFPIWIIPALIIVPILGIVLHDEQDMHGGAE